MDRSKHIIQNQVLQNKGFLTFYRFIQEFLPYFLLYFFMNIHINLG